MNCFPTISHQHIPRQSSAVVKCLRVVRYIDQDILITNNQRHFDGAWLLLGPGVETPAARGFALLISS